MTWPTELCIFDSIQSGGMKEGEMIEIDPNNTYFQKAHRLYEENEKLRAELEAEKKHGPHGYVRKEMFDQIREELEVAKTRIKELKEVIKRHKQICFPNRGPVGWWDADPT